MQYLYSPSTRGFYLPEIHGDAIPADAAAISEDDRQTILNTVHDRQVLPPTVPSVVTMRQARLALLAAGKLAAANAAVAAAGEAVQIAWEFSSEVRRDNPLVTSLAQALSLDAAALDDLFTQAAAL